MERRLAAILAADVVSYSRLMASDEADIRAELLAACHAPLGQIDEARVHADAVLNMYPALQVADVRLWKSFRNEADRQNLEGALCEAGLP